MCKQITNIHSIRSDKVRHLGIPLFRASAQGGDRYPKHGTDQSDRVLPQNRRRPDRTGKTGVRCPRSRSNPANQIAELPLKPKAGTFGCGHRNRERKKQGTDLMESLFPPCFLLFPFQSFRRCLNRFQKSLLNRCQITTVNALVFLIFLFCFLLSQSMRNRTSILEHLTVRHP